MAQGGQDEVGQCVLADSGDGGRAGGLSGGHVRGQRGDDPRGGPEAAFGPPQRPVADGLVDGEFGQGPGVAQRIVEGAGPEVGGQLRRVESGQDDDRGGRAEQGKGPGRGALPCGIRVECDQRRARQGAQEPGVAWGEGCAAERYPGVGPGSRRGHGDRVGYALGDDGDGPGAQRRGVLGDAVEVLGFAVGGGGAGVEVPGVAAVVSQGTPAKGDDAPGGVAQGLW